MSTKQIDDRSPDNALVFEIPLPRRKRRFKKLSGPSESVRVKKEVNELVDAMAIRFNMNPATLRSILILIGISSMIWGGEDLIPRTKGEYRAMYKTIRRLAKNYFNLGLPEDVKLEEDEESDEL